MVKPQEPWFAVGVGVALAGVALYGVTWQTDATADSRPSGTAWMYVASGVLFVLGIATALASTGAPASAWRSLARRRRPRLPTAVTESEAPEDRVIEALLPMVIDGQLRLTLRYSDGAPLSLHGVEVQVSGPDGTFPLVRAGTDAHLDGIYRVQFPRDFRAGRLAPGKYVIRWTQGLFNPNSNNFDAVGVKVVAESHVQVTDNMEVRPTADGGASPQCPGSEGVDDSCSTSVRESQPDTGMDRRSIAEPGPSPPLDKATSARRVGRRGSERRLSAGLKSRLLSPVERMEWMGLDPSGRGAQQAVGIVVERTLGGDARSVALRLVPPKRPPDLPTRVMFCRVERGSSRWLAPLATGVSDLDAPAAMDGVELRFPNDFIGTHDLMAHGLPPGAYRVVWIGDQGFIGHPAVVKLADGTLEMPSGRWTNR